VKLLVIILTLHFTTSVSAMEDVDCQAPLNQDQINYCYKKLSKDFDAKIYQTEDYSILATKKMVFTLRDGGDPKVIYGEISTLDEILSVTISEDRQEIALLNVNNKGVKEILFFPLNINGTVGPFRTIWSDKIQQCNRIKFKLGGEEITAYDDGSESSYSFQSSSNSRSYKKELQPTATTEPYNEY